MIQLSFTHCITHFLLIMKKLKYVIIIFSFARGAMFCKYTLLHFIAYLLTSLLNTLGGSHIKYSIYPPVHLCHQSCLTNWSTESDNNLLFGACIFCCEPAAFLWTVKRSLSQHIADVYFGCFRPGVPSLLVITYHKMNTNILAYHLINNFCNCIPSKHIFHSRDTSLTVL